MSNHEFVIADWFLKDELIKKKPSNANNYSNADWNSTETEMSTLLTSSYNNMVNTLLTVRTTKYYPVRPTTGNIYPGSKV